MSPELNTTDGSKKNNNNTPYLKLQTMLKKFFFGLLTKNTFEVPDVT